MSDRQQRFGSPLRYPGGKGVLANYFKLLLLTNRMYDGDYVEVYAGGAGVACSLLLEEYVRNIHINDINPAIYAFWRSVTQNTEELCKMIQDTPITIDVWQQQKKIQMHPADYSEVELGFSTFYLNRTNRSGIIRGGIIGGKTQQGKWKLDARFNKSGLIERIERIARYSKRIKLYNQDAARFITTTVPLLPANTLIYLDPPYYVQGGNLYENHYTHQDHAAISQIIQQAIKHPWVVSYDNVNQIKLLYEQQRVIAYDLSYSAREHYQGSELMFFSKNLSIPPISNPARIQKMNLIN